MQLPTYEETMEPLEKPGALLLREDFASEVTTAIKVAELLTRQDITRKVKETVLLLSTEAFTLPDYPVHHVRVAGQPIDHDPRLGRIYPDLPPSTYTVSYEVGYETGNLPAIFKQLLQNLIRYRITDGEDFKEQVIAEIEVIRNGRNKTAQERGDGQTS